MSLSNKMIYIRSFLGSYTKFTANETIYYGTCRDRLNQEEHFKINIHLVFPRVMLHLINLSNKYGDTYQQFKQNISNKNVPTLFLVKMMD